MSRPGCRVARGVAGAAAVVALGLAAAGCGSASEAPVASEHPDAEEAPGAGEAPVAEGSAPVGRPAPAPSGAGSRPVEAPAARPSPDGGVSLPPGDPGLDAPSVPDPGAAGAAPHEHGAVRRTVPVEAMLTAADVRMMLGDGWRRHAGGGDECLVPQGAAGLRSMSYGGASAGIVVETVAGFADADGAEAAVTVLADEATGCGWTDVSDPRLGSASVSAADGPRSLTAVAAEGVLVLLVGSGDVARDAGRWGALVDLAIGSACPAAPDGCH